MIAENFPPWPDCYLHIRECRSGEELAVALRGNTKLDLKALVKRWIRREFCGEFRLDGNIMPRIEGDYYAAIILDCRPPESIAWTSGGFYITPNE